MTEDPFKQVLRIKADAFCTGAQVGWAIQMKLDGEQEVIDSLESLHACWIGYAFQDIDVDQMGQTDGTLIKEAQDVFLDILTKRGEDTQ